MVRTLYLNPSEAKNRIKTVRRIVSEYSGVHERKIKLRSALNNDLGIDGQDSWELLEVCEKEFGIKKENFNLTDYFSNTEPPSDILKQLLVDLPIALFAIIFIRPFSKARSQEILRRFCRQDFTFGDLVVWTFSKDFVLRNQVDVRFSRG
jgi:acyl carrier protein